MIIREGKAKILNFWHGVHQRGYLDDMEIKLHDTGLIEAKSVHEDVTLHISNCFIVWDFKEEDQENKIRVLKPKND